MLVVSHACFQLTIFYSPLRTLGTGSIDLSAAAVVFAITTLTLGRWERLLPQEALARPESGTNDLQGKVGWVMLPMLAFAIVFHWLA